MLRPVLASLPFLAVLAAGPVNAQQEAVPVALQLAATRSHVPAVAAPTQQIFTLAWVDERLPVSLRGDTPSAPGPTGLKPRRIFTLTWQQVPGDLVAVRPAQPVNQGECQIVTLVAEPRR